MRVGLNRLELFRMVWQVRDNVGIVADEYIFVGETLDKDSYFPKSSIRIAVAFPFPRLRPDLLTHMSIKVTNKVTKCSALEYLVSISGIGRVLFPYPTAMVNIGMFLPALRFSHAGHKGMDLSPI